MNLSLRLNHISKPTNSFIQSPCIRVCTLDPDDLCVGCYRSLSEIVQWNEATNQQRTEILQRCSERRKTMNLPNNRW